MVPSLGEASIPLAPVSLPSVRGIQQAAEQGGRCRGVRGIQDAVVIGGGGVLMSCRAVVVWP